MRWQTGPDLCFWGLLGAALWPPLLSSVQSESSPGIGTLCRALFSWGWCPEPGLRWTAQTRLRPHSASAPLRRLPVIRILCCFNACSVTKGFFFLCYLCGEDFWIGRRLCFYFPNIGLSPTPLLSTSHLSHKCKMNFQNVNLMTLKPRSFSFPVPRD